MGQGNFKIIFELNNFREIFYCGMTRLSNNNFAFLIQCQDTNLPWHDQT